MATETKQSVVIVVYGTPKPAGSKRAIPIRKRGKMVGSRVVDDCEKSRDWKTDVAWAARAKYTDSPMGGPLMARFRFFVKRPKSHYGTGRNSDTLKDSAPRYPVIRPDVLKLSRAVEDALTGLVYEDDAQIVSECITKEFGLTERVEIEIEQM